MSSMSSIQMSSLSPSPSPSPPAFPAASPPPLPRFSILTSFIPSPSQLRLGRRLLNDILSIPTISSPLFRYLCSSLSLTPLPPPSALPPRRGPASVCDGRNLELHMGLFFHSLGFSIVECGGGRGDGGVDLRVRGQEGDVVVQCKQFRDAIVTVGPVMQMLGVMYLTSTAQGLFVTTYRFTQGARQLQKEAARVKREGRGALAVDLWDGDTLAGLLGLQHDAIVALRTSLMQRAMQDAELLHKIRATDSRGGYCLEHAVSGPTHHNSCAAGCLPWVLPADEADDGGVAAPPATPQKPRGTPKRGRPKRTPRPIRAQPQPPAGEDQADAEDGAQGKEVHAVVGELEEGREAEGRGEAETVERCVEWHPPSPLSTPPPTPPRLSSSEKVAFLTPTRLSPILVSPRPIPPVSPPLALLYPLARPSDAVHSKFEAEDEDQPLASRLHSRPRLGVPLTASESRRVEMLGLHCNRQVVRVVEAALKALHSMADLPVSVKLSEEDEGRASWLPTDAPAVLVVKERLRRLAAEFSWDCPWHRTIVYATLFHAKRVSGGRLDWLQWRPQGGGLVLALLLATVLLHNGHGPGAEHLSSLCCDEGEWQVVLRVLQRFRMTWKNSSIRHMMGRYPVNHGQLLMTGLVVLPDEDQHLLRLPVEQQLRISASWPKAPMFSNVVLCTRMRIVDSDGLQRLYNDFTNGTAADTLQATRAAAETEGSEEESKKDEEQQPVVQEAPAMHLRLDTTAQVAETQGVAGVTLLLSPFSTAEVSSVRVDSVCCPVAPMRTLDALSAVSEERTEGKPPLPPRLSLTERQAITAGLCLSPVRDVTQDEVKVEKAAEDSIEKAEAVVVPSEEWVEEMEMLALNDRQASTVRTEEADTAEEDSVHRLQDSSSDDSEGIEGSIRPPIVPPSDVDLSAERQGQLDQEDADVLSEEEELEAVSSDSDEEVAQPIPPVVPPPPRPPVPLRPLMSPPQKRDEAEEAEAGRRSRAWSRWSDEEEMEISAGILKWGEGCWAKILKDGRSLKECNRTGCDVRNKWRNMQIKAVREQQRARGWQMSSHP